MFVASLDETDWMQLDEDSVVTIYAVDDEVLEELGGAVALNDVPAEERSRKVIPLVYVYTEGDAVKAVDVNGWPVDIYQPE